MISSTYLQHKCQQSLSLRLDAPPCISVFSTLWFLSKRSLCLLLEVCTGSHNVTQFGINPRLQLQVRKHTIYMEINLLGGFQIKRSHSIFTQDIGILGPLPYFTSSHKIFVSYIDPQNRGIFWPSLSALVDVTCSSPLVYFIRQ